MQPLPYSHAHTIYEIQLQKNIVLRMPPRHQATLRQSFCSIPSQTCTCLCTEQQSMTTIMQPFQCDLQPQSQETQRTTHTGTTTRCKTQRTNQNDPSRTCRTQEVPFIPGRSHPTRKNEIFRSPASPKHSPCNIHAAIAMRFAASRRKPARIYAQQQSMTTRIMQPFQCDLQPPFQETQRTTHTGTTSRCKMQRTNRNDPSRTRRTQEVLFIAGCSHFTRKNARFRAPVSSS